MEGRIKFRVDLQAHKYDDVEDRDTVVLKDPVSGKYFYLSVYEYRLLKTLDGNRTLEEATERLAVMGYYYSLEEAGAIVAKAAQMGLVLGTKFGTAMFQEHLKQQIEASKKARRWASIYFMFIPLLNPDKFLEKTLWIAKLFANKFTIGLFALALPGAIYCLISGLAGTETEYLFFFNLENLIYLWITLALTKLLHEFAHAYVAKSFGIHVPEMGVAFLIFFPCLFCNTTDAWQLADRKQRIAISAAGILVEGALAIAATYVWYFTNPGVINSLAFYLMAVSFFSTVLFNGNPLMRFDGYFILMDWLRLPNLSTRALAYVKYLFMNRVLGISLFVNPATTPREVIIFSIYGVCAFLYRLFLYTMICVGVYYRFDKLLGLILASLAFVLFIVIPLTKGVRTLYSKRKEIHPQPSGVLVFSALVCAIVLILVAPLPRRSIYPCYLASAKVQKLTVPLQTSVADVFIREGKEASEGALLFTLDDSLLKLALFENEIRREILRTEVKYLLLDPGHRGEAASKEIELRKLDHKTDRIRRDLALAENGIVAPFEGVVTNMDYRLQTGFQPGEGVVVGEFESLTDCTVYALVPAKDLPKLHTGQDVRIWFRMGSGIILTGTIEEIRPYGEQDLRDMPFSSRFGGDMAIEARGEDRTDVPLEALFRCSVSFRNVDRKIPLGMTGKLVVDSPRTSLWSRSVEGILEGFHKESIFW
ncbi:MAG: HlyD family efflux transporter periplasmic adaptor subunit [Desulfomonile tiedjei]|nr:HlyD family efflux transporter periplasmic adaptor subunit [Desulfomonile tiedjei]